MSEEKIIDLEKRLAELEKKQAETDKKTDKLWEATMIFKRTNY